MATQSYHIEFDEDDISFGVSCDWAPAVALALELILSLDTVTNR